MLKELKQRVMDRKSKIGIIGLGYVGLPLAVNFAKNGFKVYGIDIDKDRVERLNKGESYILDVPTSDIAEVKKGRRMTVTADFSVIKECDAVIICVPTPITKAKEPDVSYIVSAVEMIKKYMKRGQIVVLESTTYPGTTEEVMLPVLESTGLKEGKDFYLAFSPERIDPGNKKYKTENTPKIIGGISSESTELATLLYSQVIEKVVPVSSSKVAEMVKLLENTFRIVNIGMVNELMLMCDKLGIDVWEVIDAAKTKPYGFMPFYPGPGVGGHCIPVDPIYLSWKARSHGFEARFIDLASNVNSRMPHYVVNKVASALNGQKKALNGSRVLAIGAAYKKDVKDLRESPALEIIELLKQKGTHVSYYDPYLPYLKMDGIDLKSVKLTKDELKKADCVVIITDHSNVDYDLIAENSKLVVDTRNTLKNIKNRKNIVRL
ncbi:MAG: nucleotide sugar dehydrogenase [Candidatus Omnitrophota bacterium]|jgi:UDP-N-acetyl-D-glucosamine dehydrogenase